MTGSVIYNHKRASGPGGSVVIEDPVLRSIEGKGAVKSEVSAYFSLSCRK